MPTQKISKLVRLKEWISPEEARALLSDLIDEDIGSDIFRSEVIGHLPLYIEPADKDAGYFGAIREKDIQTHPKLTHDPSNKSAHIDISEENALDTLFELITTRLPYLTTFDSPTIVSPRTINGKKQKYIWFVVSLNNGLATSFNPRDSALATISTETQAVFKLAERLSGKTPWKGAPWTSLVKTHATISKGGRQPQETVTAIPPTHTSGYQLPASAAEITSGSDALLLVISSLLEQATKSGKANQSGIITGIVERFGDEYGISQSSLEKLFARAKGLRSKQS